MATTTTMFVGEKMVSVSGICPVIFSSGWPLVLRVSGIEEDRPPDHTV